MHKLGAEMHLDLHSRSQELHRASSLLSLRGGHLRVPTVTLPSHRRSPPRLPDQHRAPGLRRKMEGKSCVSHMEEQRESVSAELFFYLFSF